MRSPAVPLGEHNPNGHTGDEVLSALRGRAVLTTYDDDAEVQGMTLRVVDQGEAAFLDLMTSVGYELRLFTNDVTDGLTSAQIDALTADDFEEATFLGYVPAALSAGGWAVTSGNPAAAVYPRRTFTSSANQAAQDMVGYYVTRLGVLRWFEYFPAPVTVDGAGQLLRVTPRLTMQDQGD